jgi:rhodanese-related sulfurtransferase
MGRRPRRHPLGVYNVIGDTGHFGAAPEQDRDLTQPAVATPQVTAIDRDELAAKLAAGTIVLIDAQGPGWYDEGHIPGAHPVDRNDIAATAATHIPAADTEVAVYCWNAACNGSAIVADKLVDLGYTNIRRYIDGKQDWQAHGHPLAEREQATKQPVEG